MNAALTQWIRSIRAEAVRAGGLRGPLIRAALPGGVILPLIVTAGIALIAESLASMSGEVQVTSVETANSVYWIITITVLIWALIAATAQAGRISGAGSELDRFLFPRSWTGPAARWITYGAGAAATSGVLAMAVMLLLPPLFPKVYAGVDLTSPAGIRLMLCIPLYAFFACGIAVGVGAVIGHPTIAAAALVVWVYLIENSIALIPHGYTAQGYMPFLNGVFGTGQQLAFTPPWGPDGALIYCAAVSVVVFLLGCGAIRLRRGGHATLRHTHIDR